MQRRRAVLALVVVLGALLALWVVGTGTTSGEAQARSPSRGCGLDPAVVRPVPEGARRPPATLPIGVVEPAEPAPEGPSPLPVAPDLAPEGQVAPVVREAVPGEVEVQWLATPSGLGRVATIDYDIAGRVLVRDAEGQVFRGPKEGPLVTVAPGVRAKEVVAGPLMLVQGEVVAVGAGRLSFGGPWVAPFGALARRPGGPIAVRADDLTASRILVGEALEQAALAAVAIVPRGVTELVWAVDGAEIAGIDGGELLVWDRASGEVRREGPSVARPVATQDGWWVLRGDELGPPEGGGWVGVAAPLSGRLGATDAGDWVAAAGASGGVVVGSTEGGVPTLIALTGSLVATDVRLEGDAAQVVVAERGPEHDRIGWLQVPREEAENGAMGASETP